MKLTYYAIVNDYSTLEHPSGVIRRSQDDEGEHDEVFTRDLTWERTPLLYSHERGNQDAQFHEISEAEALEIVGRIRRSVGGA